jgi:hypothetical protein
MEECHSRAAGLTYRQHTLFLDLQGSAPQSANDSPSRLRTPASISGEAFPMSSLQSAWQALLSVKRRVFVSYHHGGDLAYYDAFSKAFHDDFEAISDTSLERAIDSDNSDYVIRQLRERCITGSSCTIVLVGRNTSGRKFVDWEIKATLDANHGLIWIQLPTLPVVNGLVSVPERLNDNISSGYAVGLHWNVLTASPAELSRQIEIANGKSTTRIVNNRPRRLRNAPLI